MRKFTKHDFLMICDWLAKHGKKVPEYHFFPPTGLILDSAACGFLIRCDNNIGILDFFITNPDVPQVQRYAAVEEIAACLIEIAKKDQIKLLKCDTEIPSIARLAEKHGFHSIGTYESFMRGL